MPLRETTGINDKITSVKINKNSTSLFTGTKSGQIYGSSNQKLHVCQKHLYGNQISLENEKNQFKEIARDSGTEARGKTTKTLYQFQEHLFRPLKTSSRHFVSFVTKIERPTQPDSSSSQNNPLERTPATHCTNNDSQTVHCHTKHLSESDSPTQTSVQLATSNRSEIHTTPAVAVHARTRRTRKGSCAPPRDVDAPFSPASGPEIASSAAPEHAPRSCPDLPHRALFVGKNVVKRR